MNTQPNYLARRIFALLALIGAAYVAYHSPEILASLRSDFMFMFTAAY